MTKAERYSVALSFAGEDRRHAKKLKDLLKAAGVTDVFYDNDRQHELWGKNLYEHLFDLYRRRAKYIVVFVSASYKKKRWTTHERRAMQDGAFDNPNADHVLPIRIDKTRLPGMPSTIAYLSLDLGIPKIATLLLKKLGVATPPARVGVKKPAKKTRAKTSAKRATKASTASRVGRTKVSRTTRRAPTARAPKPRTPRATNRATPSPATSHHRTIGSSGSAATPPPGLPARPKPPKPPTTRPAPSTPKSDASVLAAVRNLVDAVERVRRTISRRAWELIATIARLATLRQDSFAPLATVRRAGLSDVLVELGRTQDSLQEEFDELRSLDYIDVDEFGIMLSGHAYALIDLARALMIETRSAERAAELFERAVR